VLVVDDYEDLRFMLRVVLEGRGFEVLEAANGLEAIEVAGNMNPNLILMDCNLSLLDGLSATRRIRQQETLREVPIVALSGDARPNASAVALSAGCTGYLLKPFALETLNELLDQHLHA
jgi:CheY-like chemotaxis protein